MSSGAAASRPDPVRRPGFCPGYREKPATTYKENPRNRKTPKRGRKRLFNAAIHSLRLCVERTFAWEDKFKRLLLRFEFKQQRHYAMKLMAFTLISLRRFCGA